KLMNSAPQKVETKITRRPLTWPFEQKSASTLRAFLKFAFLAILIVLFVSPALESWFAARNHFGTYFFLMAAGLSFVATPFVGSLARRFSVLDFPDARKVHASPTPLWGGLAIYGAFVVVTIFNLPFSDRILGVLIGASLLVLAGVIDDLKGLPARMRLLNQTIAALIVVESGISLDIISNEHLSVFIEPILTVVWIVGLTNAFNFFDGMDGLAAGIGAIAAFFMALVALQTHQRLLIYFSLTMMGACFGFLPFNFRWNKAAKIFLGDSGSNLIGFILASLAVMGEWANNDSVKAFSIPILIFGVLIFDMIYISISRIATKRVRSFNEWIGYVGKDHLHHRLFAMGLSKKQCVLFIYFLMIAFGLSAVILKNGRTIDAVLGIIQMASMLTIISILMKKGGEMLQISKRTKS
ncbi:MAG: glycosyltransferase family 4 protein, partial [bacterium]